MSATTSWVICEIATGKAVLETFEARTKDAINKAKYKAVPILEYLQGINQAIAAQRTAGGQYAQ